MFDISPLDSEIHTYIISVPKGIQPPPHVQLNNKAITTRKGTIVEQWSLKGYRRKRNNEAMVYRRHERTRSSWASFPALNDAWVSSFPAEFELYILLKKQIQHTSYVLVG